MKKSPLFYGVNDDELYILLKCRTSEQVPYEDGEYTLRMGESVNTVLVLLRGKACVIQENFWGYQEHIYRVKEEELFGQSYSCIRTPVLPVSVVIEGGCEALFLNHQRMITLCPLACDFYTRLIHNMLCLVPEHNMKLENRLEHACHRTTGEKPLSCLSEQATAKGGRAFDILYNCQELAEYLCVDRSVVSSELNKMWAEGILDFQKNHFVFHDRDTGEYGEGAQGQSIYQDRYLLKKGDNR